jgi:uncharacterized protein involved in type VI secretion and phage assembly
MSFTNLKSGGERKKNYGVVIGIVTNNNDPESLGRVKLKFPWRDSSDESNWARVAVPMAGGDRGIYFLPEVGDEVLVSFAHGDMTQPYVIGGLWNGADKPPEKNADGKNNKRIIKSKSGHMIIFNDERGSGKIEIRTGSGHQIVLDDSSGNERIEVKDKTGSNHILIDSAQNSISMSSQMKISIQAQMIEIKAGATLDLKGGLVKIN